MNVEHVIFTPLVFSLTGDEVPEAPMFHKHIAQKVSAKIEDNYNRVLSLIRCQLCFFGFEICFDICQRTSFGK